MPDDLELEEDPDTGEKYVRLSEKDAIAQRDLARKAKDAEAATSERDAAQRELAFLKAGVNPEDSKVAALFIKSYDGELTADAIKAAYADLGVTTTETTTELTPEQQAAAEAEAKQTAERGALTRGSAGASELPPRDPRELAAEAVDRARKQGWSEDRSLAEGFRELVTAAAAGDKRVRLPGFGTQEQ